MAVTILHMSDAHLDTPFGSREALRQQLRQAQLESFRQAAAMAKSHGADVFLVTGDLYDSELLDYGTAQCIREVFSGLLAAGIAVLYAHGNHDPASESGALELPEGVAVFSDPEPEEWILRREGRELARFSGMGFREKTARFPGALPPRTVLPTIGVAHAHLTELGGQADSMGVSARTLKETGYDYWALGHVHARQTIEGSIAYPGCLTGRDYGETGEKGVLLVRAEAFRPPEIRFLPVPGTRFAKLEAKDRSETTLSALAATLEGMARPLLTAGGGMTMLRIELSGRFGAYRELTDRRGQDNLNALAAKLTGLLGVTDVTVEIRDMFPPVRPEEHEGENSLLGKAMELAKEAAFDDATADALLAELSELRFVEDRFLSDEERREYLRSLLPGMDARLCTELVKEEG